MRGYLQEFQPYGMGTYASGSEQEPCTHYAKRKAALYYPVGARCSAIGYYNSFADCIRSKQAEA